METRTELPDCGVKVDPTHEVIVRYAGDRQMVVLGMQEKDGRVGTDFFYISPEDADQLVEQLTDLLDALENLKPFIDRAETKLPW